MKKVLCLLMVLLLVMPMAFVGCDKGPKASEGLRFAEMGKNACFVVGLGTCTDTDIVIPKKSPDGDKVIGIEGFSGCTDLKSITLPDSVTIIGWHAFSGCTGLTSITIPDSVTSICGYAFKGCDALTDVWFTGTEKKWSKIEIGEGNDVLSSATIHYNYVPEE